MRIDTKILAPLLLATLGGVHQAISAATLVENVHIIPMTGEGKVLDGAVLVNDGRVLAVGPLASIKVPAGADRIDGGGGYLVPGLTDMHNHIDSPESLKLQLAYGVTTVRNMWGTDEILAQRKAERTGELLAPDIETTSPILDNDPPYFKGSVTIAEPGEAESLVTELKDQGYTALKTYELIKADVYAALVDAADRNGMTIEGHIPQAVDAFAAVKLGHDTIEHSMRIDAAIVDPAIPYSSAFRPPELVDLVARIDAGELTYEQAFSRERLREFGRAMVENGTALVPTLGVYEVLSYSEEDREAIAQHPLIEYVNPAFRAFWLQGERGEEMTNNGVRAELTDAEIASLEYFASTEHGKWVEVLHQEGVLILAGVDAPNPAMFQGYSLHDELRHMVERAGMSNYEALKTATVNPAIYWGIEGQRGVIAPGAEADMILLEKNPLEDISNTKTIRGVMADGRWLDRAHLDKLLVEVRESYIAMAEELETGAEPASGFPVHLHHSH
ncbi:MAG: amidohydrolase family protein [Haliea sp.]|uniref:amidohydrolase family protein n=1 Tax=Haliea sp. TaxID=1932666 RepID=UPI0032F05F82